MAQTCASKPPQPWTLNPNLATCLQLSPFKPGSMLPQVEQTGADGGAEAAAPAAPAAGGTHPPRPPGIERPPSGPHGRHHSPSPTRTGGGEREHPPAGPHMARVGSGERQRLGRLSASSGGSAAGAQRPAIARQGSVPLRERLTSIQRQGSLAARQVRSAPSPPPPPPPPPKPPAPLPRRAMSRR